MRPGITVHGTPAAAQASASSKPRPKTKVSPPLNRTTRLPGQRPVDDDPVDLLLRRGPAAGQLGHVDQLDVRRQLVEQLARRQPVGDHHVGLAQRVAGPPR